MRQSTAVRSEARDWDVDPWAGEEEEAEEEDDREGMEKEKRSTYQRARRGAKHVLLRNVPVRTVEVFKVLAKERGVKMREAMIEALNAYAANYHL